MLLIIRITEHFYAVLFKLFKSSKTDLLTILKENCSQKNQKQAVFYYFQH